MIGISPQQSGEAKVLAQQLAASSNISFEDAWNSVRNARPDLFTIQNRESEDDRSAEVEIAAPRPRIEDLNTTQVIAQYGYRGIAVRKEANRNRQLVRPDQWSQADERELMFNREDAVNDYKYKHPGISHEAAYNAVRRKQPELFPVH